MNHIHFLSSNHTVCEKPKMLGLDTVVVDYSDELCKICMGLIFSYNEKIENFDLALSIPRTPIEDPLAPARGFLVGVLLGTIFWLTLALGVWLLWLR